MAESLPCSDGKSHLTTHYCSYLASWAKEISWQSVASRFRTSWQTVCRAVQSVAAYGLKNRKIDHVEAIGLDEVLWHKGHEYLTLVYQIDIGYRRLHHAEVRQGYRQGSTRTCNSCGTKRITPCHGHFTPNSLHKSR